MKFIHQQERPPRLMQQLLELWEGSVRATHLFLSDEEILAIREYVPQALREVPHLIVAAEEDGSPVAFMGVAGQKLEMLFVSAGARGRGIGRQLLTHGIDVLGIDELAVNEQNPSAKGFYEHMGFRVVRRTDHDEQGKPYPLLYMRREK